ncbi:MAG: DUF362 domain-containing protein [Pseudomonadota bacterium]
MSRRHRSSQPLAPARRTDSSRRRFLGDSARLVAGASTLALSSCFPEVGGRWPGVLARCSDETTPPPLAVPGTVVEVIDPLSVIGESRPEIQAEVVAQMLEQALGSLAGGVVEPWRTLLPEVTASTRLGLKVNCLNQQCSTSVELVRALVDSLKAGLGLDGEQIVVWDRRLDELTRSGFTEEAVGARVLGTVNSTSDPGGPGFEDDFCHVVNGKTTRLTRLLTRETDVGINVPVLKTHGVSGVTAALKNVYGVIDNPGDFHKDLVDALPKIYALAPVREYFKLSILDALIAVTVGGTSSPPDTVPGRVLAARDPLALDRRALALVNQLRQAKGVGLRDIDPRVTAWLDGAHALGVGAREVSLLLVDRS